LTRKKVVTISVNPKINPNLQIRSDAISLWDVRPYQMHLVHCPGIREAVSVILLYRKESIQTCKQNI